MKKFKFRLQVILNMKEKELEKRLLELAKVQKSLQEAMLGLKKRFGKNAVLKGSNYLEGATMRDRNGRIGGHKAE